MEIKDAIKKGLFRKSISQKKLAEFTDVSESTVSQWISGSSKPKSDDLVRIINYLEIADLLFSEQIKKVKEEEQKKSYEKQKVSLKGQEKNLAELNEQIKKLGSEIIIIKHIFKKQVGGIDENTWSKIRQELINKGEIEGECL